MTVARVLGYGALLDLEHVRALCGEARVLASHVGVLTGWRRHWGLVYRNGCWDDGCFVQARTGAAHDGGIAFLGVTASPGEACAVREIEVSREALAVIDAEEYLYRREDVTGAYRRADGTVPPPPTWLYVDHADEHPDATYAGPDVVVTRTYADCVVAAAAEVERLVGRADVTRMPPPPRPVVDLEWEWRPQTDGP